MAIFIFNNTKEIRKNKQELERALKLKITIEGKKVTTSGDPMKDYEASIVLDAINFGFSARKALVLLDPTMQFKLLNIKKFTRKSRLKDARSRIIGTEGKTKRAIENICNCDIVISENEVGIIAPGDSIEETVTGIINMIKGSKQGNVYAFLEKMNSRRKLYGDDLGLKIKDKRTLDNPQEEYSEDNYTEDEEE